jgi:hypothetical protein
MRNITFQRSAFHLYRIDVGSTTNQVYVVADRHVSARTILVEYAKKKKIDLNGLKITNNTTAKLAWAFDGSVVKIEVFKLSPSPHHQIKAATVFLE